MCVKHLPQCLTTSKHPHTPGFKNYLHHHPTPTPISQPILLPAGSQPHLGQIFIFSEGLAKIFPF